MTMNNSVAFSVAPQKSATLPRVKQRSTYLLSSYYGKVILYIIRQLTPKSLRVNEASVASATLLRRCYVAPETVALRGYSIYPLATIRRLYHKLYPEERRIGWQ